MNDVIIAFVDHLLVPIIITVIVPFIISLIRQKIAQLENEKARSLLDGALYELQGAVSVAVSAVSQTYVDALKKEKKFSAESQKEAFRQAYQKSISLLSTETLDYLKTKFSDEDFEELIGSYIESIIYANK